MNYQNSTLGPSWTIAPENQTNMKALFKIRVFNYPFTVPQLEAVSASGGSRIDTGTLAL